MYTISDNENKALMFKVTLLNLLLFNDFFCRLKTNEYSLESSVFHV